MSNSYNETAPWETVEALEARHDELCEMVSDLVRYSQSPRVPAGLLIVDDKDRALHCGGDFRPMEFGISAVSIFPSFRAANLVLARIAAKNPETRYRLQSVTERVQDEIKKGCIAIANVERWIKEKRAEGSC